MDTFSTRSAAKASHSSDKSLCFLTIRLTNLLRMKAAVPMTGTMPTEMERRWGSISSMFLMANMTDLEDRIVFAMVVVMVSETFWTSSARMDWISAGVVALRSGVPVAAAPAVVVCSGASPSFAVASRGTSVPLTLPVWYHSIFRFMSFSKTCERKLDAMESCARFNMVVRRNEASPPPSTTNKSELFTMPLPLPLPLAAEQALLEEVF
mmetsp:Transcript_13124/g.19131  ORF Transcript_13124/g.19131 Transcript_13124/m.19131 type:complete len:209 (-) Transcript_13124:194-820(-)